MSAAARFLGRVLLCPLLICAAVAAPEVGAQALAGESFYQPRTSYVTHLPSPVEAKLLELGCWTGEAPEGAIAGRVVVTWPAAPERPVVWTSKARVDHAIEHAKYGGPGRYVVRGFCR